MPEQSVPVYIDSIKRIDDFQRTRCVYFRIDIDDEPPSWSYDISGNDQVLLHTWGSWSVLLGPGQSNDAEGLFSSPDSIDRALQSIEETEGPTLDLGNIWLPNDLLDLEGEGKEVRSGDVYRLSPSLFRQCYRFSVEMITEAEWLDSCRSDSHAIWPSPRETAAFREWRKGQIKRSSERYHHPDYANRRLGKKKSKP